MNTATKVFVLPTSLADIERQVILESLELFGGNKTRTAAALGISLKTLYNKLHAYGAM
jgi:two-component system response regulator AtoC